MTPFCIVGTPRSRTAWFAEFLSHGRVRCEHEPSKYWRDDADLRNYFREGVGAVDSMLTFKLPELIHAGVNVIAIVRPRREVERSIALAGMPAVPAILDSLYSVLGNCPTPMYEFSELSDHTCGAIFARLLGYTCPPGWLRFMSSQNIQADYAHVRRAVTANPGFLSYFKLEN